MTEYLDGRVIVHAGDCREILKTLADNSVDSVVTDPPYFLTSINKRFSADNAAPCKPGSDGSFARLSGGFMGRKWDSPDSPAIDPGFAHWFAGFVDGEGCFSVHKKHVNNCETYDCQFAISLRDDDKPIIVEIQKQLGGIGTIADVKKPKQENAKPQIRYCISSQAHCQRLRAILQVFPLRAKKARDFEIWSQALDAWLNHEPGQSWEEVAYFRDRLMAVRRYGAHYHPEELFHYEWAREVLRVLKPGGYICAFGGSRTWHRMACAIEDAGFITHPMIAWVFGSGFPKAHSVSKQIDKSAGTAATDAAKQWDGWFYGTQSLKPAFEPIYLGSKPFRDCTSELIIVEFSISLETLLWLIAPVKFVEYILMNSPVDQGGSVRWLALISHALSSKEPSELMDMFALPEEAGTFLSIALLWNAILDASSQSENTSIIETEPNLIIGLKTLRSWILAIMPGNIVEEVINQNGVWLTARRVENKLNGSPVFSSTIPRPSATEGVIGINHSKKILFSLASIAAESSWLNQSTIDDIVRDPAQTAAAQKSVELEPIYLGQKPFSEKTGAANVLKWGTGAINVGATKIPGNVPSVPQPILRHGNDVEHGFGSSNGRNGEMSNATGGRWPANLIHDGSEEVLECFPDSKSTGGSGEASQNFTSENGIYGEFAPQQRANAGGLGDSGSAARFFASFPQDDEPSAKRIIYTSKADQDSRLGSVHPTVKPLKLIQYLVRLVTPPSGTCLDIFAGTGTTGEAAFREGFKAILVERELEYLKDVERRMSLVTSGKQSRKHASVKARGKTDDAGPLFGASE